MSRKLKVLLLQYRSDDNISEIAQQALRGLSPVHYEVTSVFLCGPSDSEGLNEAGRDAIFFGFSQFDIKGLRLRALWRLYRHCSAKNYDAVIAHRFKPINMLMLLNHLLHIPVCIGVLHGLGEYDRAYRRWQSRRLVTSTWNLVGVSTAVCNDLIDCGAGFGDHNVRLIENALDVAQSEMKQHAPKRARELLELPQEAFVIGTIGRLVPAKAQVHLLEAFALVMAEYPQALVAIIGEGRARPELEALIQKHGMQNRVRLLGERPEAMQYLQAFDVFALTSIKEGLPLALLEAMSGRLPIIGTDIDSILPILQGCRGRIYQAGQPEELAQRMREVMALTAEQRAAEGERAYAYLCDAYGIEGFRRKYRELLEERLRKAGRL